MILYLFEWDTYYPSGGWNDHEATFEGVGAAFVHLHRDVTRESDRPSDNAQLVMDGAAVSRWSRSVEYAGSPPRDADGETRWNAPPDEWTYPADGSRWRVSLWELEQPT